MAARRDKSSLQHQVYWITKRIAQGQFATPDRAAYCSAQGVTHILNVGEAASVVSADEYGFRDIRDCPVVDLTRIPDQTAINCLNVLHEMLAQPDSRVYIHCVAGQNRSPSILWLYFIACGLSPADAKTLIEDRTADAIAGHPQLIDLQLVATAVAHGRAHFLPLADPSITQPTNG